MFIPVCGLIPPKSCGKLVHSAFRRVNRHNFECVSNIDAKRVKTFAVPMCTHSRASEDPTQFYVKFNYSANCVMINPKPPHGFLTLVRNMSKCLSHRCANSAGLENYPDL